MIGFRPLFSGFCAAAVLAGCQGPKVYTPDTIGAYPLQQSTVAPQPVATQSAIVPVSAQPVSVQQPAAFAEPAYVLESAPAVEASPAPAYVIESETVVEPMPQSFVEPIAVFEPAYILETEAPAAAIPEPVVVEELAILSAPVLDAGAAPVVQETYSATAFEPVALDPIQPVSADVSSQDFSTFTEGGVMEMEIVEPSFGVDGPAPASAVPLMIEAEPLAPIGGLQQSGVAGYGQAF